MFLMYFQEEALKGNLIANCLVQLSDTHRSLRQWLALCLAKVRLSDPDILGLIFRGAYLFSPQFPRRRCRHHRRRIMVSLEYLPYY